VGERGHGGEYYGPARPLRDAEFHFAKNRAGDRSQKIPAGLSSAPAAVRREIEASLSFFIHARRSHHLSAMCPVCLATITALVAGSTSAAGLTALVVQRCRAKRHSRSTIHHHQKP